MTAAVCTTTVALLAVCVTPSSAQPVAGAAPASWVNRLDVAVGLVWAGGYSIGDRAAEIRQNATGSPPPSFTLFRAESTFQSAAGLEARLGFALTPALTIEGGVQWSSPHIDVEIAEDTEDANPSFDGETISQYVIDAGVRWRVPGLRPGSSLRPFATAGVAYLRQLYEERTLVETGEIYHFGGGVLYLLRGADGRRRPVGVRADVRANIRHQGIEFDDQVRVYPSLSGLMFFGF